MHIHRHARPTSTNQPKDRQRYVGNGESQSEGLKALGCRLLPSDAVHEMVLHSRITLISHFTHSQSGIITFEKSSKVQNHQFNRQSLGWRDTRRMYIIRSARLLQQNSNLLWIKRIPVWLNLNSYQFSNSAPTINCCVFFKFQLIKPLNVSN